MNRLRVLLVDDEEDLVTTLVERLSFRNIEAMAKTTGAGAIEALKAEPFDVVVLDAKMPGMDGFQVMQIMKELRPDIRIILLTGHASHECRTKALEAGACDYLLKPVDIEALIETMTAAVER